MENIYHETQEGSLCGQHCLNNLLQGKLFTAVDLAEIAQEMDKAEQQQMAELGKDTEEYLNFIKQPSGNMDDSGMFSVQVLSSALKVWDLGLVPYQSSNTIAESARNNPVVQNAYICNFREHWFAIRKLGSQWFNLNSLLSYPELISDTYLFLFLQQLQYEGYSIFVVEGSMPYCDADQALASQKVIQTVRPKLLSELSDENSSKIHENDLKRALAASMEGTSSAEERTPEQSDQLEKDLEAAIQMSLLGNYESPPSTASLTRSDSSRDDDLERAIQMSLADQGKS